MPRILLITANLGTLFDDGRLIQRWLEYMAKTVHSQTTDFVVIHLQETGGKHFEENSDKVVPLICKLHEGLKGQFENCYAFLDIDFKISEQFTALGSVFFVRNSMKDKVKIFDFQKRVFEPLEGAGLYVEPSINSSNRIRKEKFSRDFWPGVRWGRKGYMHARWSVDGNILDLINLHLFHDESNLAFHENPFQYSQNRRKAMNYMLRRYDEFAKSTKTDVSANLFLFGDFNFRLNAISFLKKLTKHASEHTLETLSDSESPKNSSDDSDPPLLNGHPILDRQLSAIEYRREDENCVLRIEKKKFEYENSKNLLSNWREYKEDDQEPNDLPLKELPVDFPPTYPWSEDPLNHNLLTNTRMPAWCDRILMNTTAFSALSNPIYTSIGMDLCMGDHKPVILAFDLP